MQCKLDFESFQNKQLKGENLIKNKIKKLKIINFLKKF